MTIIRLARLAPLLAASVAACSGGSLGTGNHAGAPGLAAGGAGGTGAAAASGGAGTTTGLAGAGGSGTACAPLPPIPRRLLALDPTQFGNATRDLLSLEAPPPPVAGVADAARSSPAELVIDAAYLQALYQAAGTIVTQVAPRATALAACTAGETDLACATRFASSFGREAFRRALDDVEVADLQDVFQAVCPGPSPSCATPADFAAAIDLMVKAFVLAPSFLYRTELGPRNLTANAAGNYPDTVLTGDEVATQLGFLLLGSTPDATLLAAADSGALDTPAGVLAEIDRLLALPPVQSHATGMVTRWLGVDQVANKAKAAALLSPLAAADQDQSAITAALRTSWDDAVTATLWSSPPGKVTDLLTAQTFYTDWRLATLYGFPHGAAADPAFQPLTWPDVQPRAGVLTHPAFLWTISPGKMVDPVVRGQAVHRDFLCADPVPLEPPGASMAGVAVGQMGDSEATHSDARLASGKLCADGCHTELDPYGRLLHAFDAAGNFRTVDEVGRPIDTSAKSSDSSPLGAMTFSGPVDFAAALVSSKVFAGCAVQRLFETALAVTVPSRNSCQVNELQAAFDGTDGTLASLLRQVAGSAFARARAGGAQ